MILNDHPKGESSYLDNPLFFFAVFVFFVVQMRFQG